MKNFKRLTTLLCICILVFGVAACGGKDKKNAEKEGEISLTMWNGFTASDGEILKEIVKDFNESNDKGITVKMDIMTWANLNEKLPSAISAKSAPDFILLNYGDFAQYVKNGAVQPLDDFWEVDGVNKEDFSDTAMQLGQIDGGQYFIPMQVQGMYLFWNKDLFEAAGLDPESPPETWDELVEMAPKLTDTSKNVSGFALPKEGNPILYNWILDNGGQLANNDGTKSAFASDETLEVLEKIQTMIHDQKVGPESISGAEVDNLMNAGQLAIEINGPWLNNGLKKNEINYGVKTLPLGSDGKEQAILDGVGFGIPSSTDSSKKDAIYEFIKFWNTTDIGKKWSLENGFPPYLKSVSEDQEIKDNEIITELYKQIEYAEPFMPGSYKIPSINNDVINPMIEKVLAGEDPKKLMDKANEEVNKILSED
ncbi:ABC transporter substrate-binding protein [Bacillus sp. J14TS2]|uniref:ABC transporter substrate-binding protein n=1 Tax=Bacillus sp. J14TS2 TaxID=2807188 RepID=UPI001B08BB0A|nr:ABC transporter substrate-binding protein [Bacillus sp. J14TS2]GIN70638.1 ABC transporter substrate-binding protein [Bacillus sp. J14TS2]